MSRIRSRDTLPEMRVRRALHALGCRYRLHARGLPGRPDLVLARFRIALFVHGCFWHRHAGCPNCTTPSTNAVFWREKFDRNVTRDAAAKRALHRLGWRTVVIWECETKNPERLNRKLRCIVRGWRNKEEKDARSMTPSARDSS